MIENALAELSARSRTSSAMADRTTHRCLARKPSLFSAILIIIIATSIMEQLVQQCSPARLGQVLSSCLSYTIFLARNRYSSHVLQVWEHAMRFDMFPVLIYEALPFVQVYAHQLRHTHIHIAVCMHTYNTYNTCNTRLSVHNITMNMYAELRAAVTSR